MRIKRIHLGKLIREKVKEKGLNDSEFGRLIGVRRQNVKKTVFEKESLDTNLLCVISEVLECNLFDYFISNIEDDIPKELKATITIEMGTEKQDKTFKFFFGNNKVELK